MFIVTYPGRLLCSQHPWGLGGGGTGRLLCSQYPWGWGDSHVRVTRVIVRNFEKNS